MNYTKRKFEKHPIYNNIKKNKIPGKKPNQRGKIFVP